MKKADAGCTLIEALVALADLITGIMIFVQTTLVSLKGAAAARRGSRSLAVAVEWMEIIRERTWEEATAGCERRSVPDKKLETALCRVERGGENYSLSLEKSLRDPLAASLTVRCDGPFPGDRSIILETALENGR